MAITAILSSKLDNRSNGDDCTFNGYLEDYLNMEDTDLDPVLREAFAGIQANAVDTRICVGLRSEINNDAISNQIIRYKDVFKLNGKPLIYPYILYVQKDEEERALLVVPYTKYGFIKAKGLYYCMTEPGSEFIDCKNEIVAICSDKADEIVKAFSNLFSQRAGALQRLRSTTEPSRSMSMSSTGSCSRRFSMFSTWSTRTFSTLSMRAMSRNREIRPS